MFASAGALLQPRGLGWGRALSPLDWVFTPNSCPVARGQPLDRPPKPTRPSPVSRHGGPRCVSNTWSDVLARDGGRGPTRAAPGRPSAERGGRSGPTASTQSVCSRTCLLEICYLHPVAHRAHSRLVTWSLHAQPQGSRYPRSPRSTYATNPAAAHHQHGIHSDVARLLAALILRLHRNDNIHLDTASFVADESFVHIGMTLTGFVQTAIS